MNKSKSVGLLAYEIVEAGARGDVKAAARARAERDARYAIVTFCSICRGTHGPEIEHASE